MYLSSNSFSRISSNYYFDIEILLWNVTYLCLSCIVSALATSASISTAVQQSVRAFHDHPSEWTHGDPFLVCERSEDDHLPFGKRSYTVSFYHLVVQRTCDTYYYPKSTYLYGAEATWKSRPGLGSDCPPVRCLLSVPVKVHGRTHPNKDMRYDIVTQPSQFIIAQMINWQFLDQLLNVAPVLFKTFFVLSAGATFAGERLHKLNFMYWSLNF